MALYTFTSRDNFAKLNRLPRPDETQLYNAIAGGQATNNSAADDNFFVKRGKSIENAFGTTGAALASGIVDATHSKGTEDMLKDNKARMEDIAKRYGYNSLDDYYDKIQAAEDAGDTATVKQLEDTIGAELKGQAKAGADAINKRAKDYQDYRENSYIGQKINQDPGKFAGSALNTLSTMTDVMLPAAGIALNTVQGGVEGIADELEQNGLENFDWGRAGQNALIGATTGAVTGAFNKGISNALAKRGGNLLKGGNKLTAGINKFNATNPIGQIGSTLATGAARGAASGAVGGATGAGLSAAMNGQDVLGSALQGAVQGAQQGATTGGIMAGVNMAANKTPGVGNVMRQLNEAGEDWNNRKAQGQDFNQRLTETLTSGDSAVGEWLQGNKQNKLLNTAGELGNRIITVNDSSAPAQTIDITSPEMETIYRGLSAKTDDDLSNYIGQISDSNIQPSTHGGGNFSGEGYNFSTGKDLAEYYATKRPQQESRAIISAEVPKNRFIGQNAQNDNRLSDFVRRAEARGYSVEDGSAARQGYEDMMNYFKKNGIIGVRKGETYVINNNDSNWQDNIEVTDALRGRGEAIEPDNELRSRLQTVVENTRANNQTPTTLGGWLKQAGKRVVEDVNNSNLGNRVKNVADQATQATEADINTGNRTNPANNMNAQWDDLAKEYGYMNYNEATKRFAQANPGTEATTENVLDWMDATKTIVPTQETVPSKTSKEAKWRRAKGQELLSQYGTVDQPTARSTKAVDSLLEIANAGFTRPEDVERMANVITGSNGQVSKLVDNLVKSAKPVNTFDGVDGKSLTDFIDEKIKLNSLGGTNAGKAVKETINANLQSLPSHSEGSITYVDAPENVFKVIQNLEASAAELEGRGGSTYHRPTTKDLHQAKVIKATADLLKERLFNGADVKQALTPEVANNLKAYDPENKAFADYVDKTIMGAKNIADLRKAQAPWVRMSKYIDNAYVQSATAGGRVAANAGDLTKILTSKNGLLKSSIDAIWNSNTAKRARANMYDKMADRSAAKEAGNATQNPTPQGETTPPTDNPTTEPQLQAQLPGAPVASTTATAPQDYNPQTRLYNAIGRTEGLTNAEQARTADYLVNAAQEAEIVPNAGTQEMSAPMTGGASTELYNSIYGNQGTAQTAQPTQANNGNSLFPVTGDYWTDMLGRALTAAINADDVEAFGQLFGMYQEQMANKSKNTSKDYSDITNWNSSDRTKLLSAQDALSQIDELENAYYNAVGEGGGNAIQGWLRSRAADLNGNLDPSAANYNKLASSVGMGIVKNLINLGVTEQDAQRYLDYLPELGDTAEQAKTKLDTLRRVYNSQINNLTAAYGA